jgi:hypothetical protein
MALRTHRRGSAVSDRLLAALLRAWWHVVLVAVACRIAPLVWTATTLKQCYLLAGHLSSSQIASARVQFTICSCAAANFLPILRLHVLKSTSNPSPDSNPRPRHVADRAAYRLWTTGTFRSRMVAIPQYQGPEHVMGWRFDRTGVAAGDSILIPGVPGAGRRKVGFQMGL